MSFYLKGEKAFYVQSFSKYFQAFKSVISKYNLN